MERIQPQTPEALAQKSESRLLRLLEGIRASGLSSTATDGAPPARRVEFADAFRTLVEERVPPEASGEVGAALASAVSDGVLRGLRTSEDVDCHPLAVNALVRLGYPWAFHISAEDLEETRRVAASARGMTQSDQLSVAATAVTMGGLVLADLTHSAAQSLGPAGLAAHLSAGVMCLMLAVSSSDAVKSPVPSRDEPVALLGATSAGLLYAGTGSWGAAVAVLMGTTLALISRRVFVKR